MPGAMQMSRLSLGLMLFILVLLCAFGMVVFTVERLRTSTSGTSLSDDYASTIDALNQAEERSIVVFKDGEMGYVTRAGRYGHLEVMERCSRKLVHVPTRTPSFLERVEKIVRVSEPNYQELRSEYIARCLVDRR